jgi:hypothetical protein
MKKAIAIFGMLLWANQSAFAATTKYSCFTDGYEPGKTIDVSFENDAFDMTTYIQMPDGSRADVHQYGSNANTIQKLQDGKTAVTGWDFSTNPPPEATMIFEKDFKSGSFLFHDGKQLLPNIVSVSCTKK